MTLERYKPLPKVDDSSQSSHERPRLATRPADAMIKRDDEQDDLSLRRVTILTSGVPIAAAAHSLDAFYSAILYHAFNIRCAQPPQPLLIMTMEPLYLTMKVMFDARVPQGIPWPFFTKFAHKMLATTSMGFTGTHNMFYVRENVGTSSNLPGLAVEIQFQIE